MYTETRESSSLSSLWFASYRPGVDERRVELLKGKERSSSEGRASQILPFFRQTDLLLFAFGFFRTYVAALTVGKTAVQSLNVILDTGSADLWLSSSSCSTCTGSAYELNPSSSPSMKV